MTIEQCLRCPECGRPLAFEPDGSIRCANHGIVATKKHGVFSFLDEGGYFEGHWDANALPAIPATKLSVARSFLAPLLTEINAAGACWLDVGAGDGVHLVVAREDAPDVECAALDVSYTGLRNAGFRAPGSVLIHADGQNIPLPDSSVHAAFSYGALAYMSDPWRGLAELVRITKPGGMIGVWCYPRSENFLGSCFRVARAVVPRLPRMLQDRIADLIVPVLGFLPTASGLSLRNASWAACREVVLVNIAPPHLIFPTRGDLTSRLEALGCRIVAEDSEHPITLWARRLAR